MKVFQGTVARVTINEAVNVKGKPLQKLRTRKSRTGCHKGRDVMCAFTLSPATQKRAVAVYIVWRCGPVCGERRKSRTKLQHALNLHSSMCRFDCAIHVLSVTSRQEVIFRVFLFPLRTVHQMPTLRSKLRAQFAGRRALRSEADDVEGG